MAWGHPGIFLLWNHLLQHCLNNHKIQTLSNHSVPFGTKICSQTLTFPTAEWGFLASFLPEKSAAAVIAFYIFRAYQEWYLLSLLEGDSLVKAQVFHQWCDDLSQAHQGALNSSSCMSECFQILFNFFIKVEIKQMYPWQFGKILFQSPVSLCFLPNLWLS